MKADADPQRIAIIAIDGTDRWEFDYADTFEEAYGKVNHWNARASREWPDLRFTLSQESQP